MIEVAGAAAADVASGGLEDCSLDVQTAHCLRLNEWGMDGRRIGEGSNRTPGGAGGDEKGREMQ